jgi:hypothetical protein
MIEITKEQFEEWARANADYFSVMEKSENEVRYDISVTFNSKKNN